MDEYERETEIIALLSNIIDDYTYVECNEDIIDHVCKKPVNGYRFILKKLNTSKTDGTGKTGQISANTVIRFLYINPTNKIL